MRSLKKILSIALCLTILGTSAGVFNACENNNTDKTKTVLDISAFSLGLGGSWFENCVQRFENANKEKEYAPGKKGVKVNINDSLDGNLSNIKTDGNAIILGGLTNNLTYHVQNGDLLSINDVMNEDLEEVGGKILSIADKIPEDEKSLYRVNGEYYAAPELEYYTATTYDRNLFNNYGLYFAKVGASGVSFYSSICNKTYTFISIGDNESKSCGPDGKYHTEDDGLPSSLYELAALCEFMKSKSISPFAVSGEYKNYCNSLLNAIMCSLQGYTADTMFTLNSDGFDVITGWTNENLFPGINYIKKPIVQTIPITEETGYYTTWSADKYYAEAFVEMITKQGWWYTGTKLETNSHTEAQTDFIYSGYGNNEKIGMLVEYSYWYNEAKFSNSFDYFYSEFNEVEERDIAFMPMPVNLEKTVTENNGEPATILSVSNSYLIVNANIKDNEEVVSAVKDFIRFYYSEKELSRTTVDLGLTKRLNYEILDSDKVSFPKYCQSLWNVRKSGNVVRIIGSTETFKNEKGLFQRGFIDGAFGAVGYRSCFSEIYNNTKTARDCFESQMVDKNTWNGYYKGSSAVADYNGLVYSK